MFFFPVYVLKKDMFIWFQQDLFQLSSFSVATISLEWFEPRSLEHLQYQGEYGIGCPPMPKQSLNSTMGIYNSVSYMFLYLYLVYYDSANYIWTYVVKKVHSFSNWDVRCPWFPHSGQKKGSCWCSFLSKSFWWEREWIYSPFNYSPWRRISHQWSTKCIFFHWFFLSKYLTMRAPSPVMNNVITPLIGLITPVSHLFSAIYRGPITPYITGLGSYLVWPLYEVKSHLPIFKQTKVTGLTIGGE